MKIKNVIDLHYSNFIFEVDVLDEKEIKKIQDFVPKLKILWRIYED